MTTKKILRWVIFWIVSALIFNTGIYFFMGKQKALEFLGGYIIEKSLSLDNLFLFLIVFESFGVPISYQRRVLNYGIASAMVLRLIFVILGVAIVNKFHWMLYIFGMILIITGIKMLVKHEESKNFKDSRILKALEKLIPVTDTFEGEKFFVRKNNLLYATPLFAILVLIEITDIIFAIDSIPAIFSITRDAFIAYSSNIFAILGLRSMYFLLVKLNNSFTYVKHGVALILTFTGLKLSLLFFHIEIPIMLSLAVIFSLLIISIAASVIFKDRTTNDLTNKG